MERLVILISVALVVSATGAVRAQDQPEAGTPDRPRVLMKTSLGDVVIELDPEHAPVSVANFLAYVDEGFYDGTIFHRVIPGFMIQGGGLTAELEKKPTRDPIKNEATNGLKNSIATVAMARTALVHSATAQFYINTVDNPKLDHRSPNQSTYGYAVFGRVVSGLNVVKRIEMTPTGSRGSMHNVPRETVTILSISRLTD